VATPEHVAAEIVNMVKNGICNLEKRKELVESVMKTPIPAEKGHICKKYPMIMIPSCMEY
jgi:hypothetical protein